MEESREHNSASEDLVKKTVAAAVVRSGSKVQNKVVVYYGYDHHHPGLYQVVPGCLDDIQLGLILRHPSLSY